jgi:hypothetical protein
MIAGTVWNQLIETLKNDPSLKVYMKNFFSGRRYDIVPESLPCIMLEPVQDGEIDKRMNNVQDIYLTLDLFAFSSQNLNEFDKTIVGDEMYKGIFDINNDIRACLIRSYTLADNVIDVRLQPTQFDQVDADKYPIRGMVMPVKILYRQINEE